MKFLQFALYFLVIKISLSAPNVDLKFNKDQANQHLLSSVRFLFISNSYVLVVYPRPGLCIKNMKSVAKHYLSYHSQKVLNEFRSGDSKFTQAVWLLRTIGM